MIRCVILAEGECSEVFEFATQAEYDAFSRGVDEGSDKYGAGSCGTYTFADLQVRQKEVMQRMEKDPNNRYRYMDEHELEGVKIGLDQLFLRGAL